jgi:hypothetical protein
VNPPPNRKRVAGNPPPAVRAPVLDPTCERLGVKFPGPTRRRLRFAIRAAVHRRELNVLSCPCKRNWKRAGVAWKVPVYVTNRHGRKTVS